MKVAILGFSDIAQSESLPTYRYFKKQGADITAYYWNNPAVPDDIEKIQIDEGADIEGLDEFDVIVRGPAVHPRQIKTDKPVTSLTNIFVDNCPTKNLIGVTGTKGKGTTSTLITKMLEAAGKKVWLGGNIGKPLLDNLDNIGSDDWVVLEMSSQQLIGFRGHVPIGVCLTIVPEHLNFFTDMAEYIAAKSCLFAAQTSDDIAIYYSDSELSYRIADAGAGTKTPYYTSPGAWVNGNLITIDGQEICTTDELKLLGKHNWQNICAAATAVWQAGVHDTAAIRAVATSFAGLPHRLEKVRVLDDVTYYNDSFASAPDAAIAALQAIEAPKVMIVGGFDRMLPIDHLAKAFVGANLRKVLLIGASAQRLAEACKRAGFDNFIILSEKTMPEIVARARAEAQTDDAIVLSPGFASFDMFKNFEDRGDQFREVVLGL